MRPAVNTRVDFMYRDACNYKTSGHAVFTGPPDEDLVDRLAGALDQGEFLVPEQVGLSHPGSEFGARFPDEEDDHGFVEIDLPGDVTVTDAAPTVPARTFAEFVDACCEANEAGWDPDLAINAAGGWTDPVVAAQLRGGDA